jgi:hypothetical protein
MLAPARTLYRAAVTGGRARDDDADAHGVRAWLAAVLFTAWLAAVVLALYLSHPIASGYRFPVGPDGPVYTWLARYAAVAGFGDTPGAGPGVSALALTLGSILRTEPVETVTVLGPVLAAVCGLAGAAALETSLGPDARMAAAAVVLTGAFAAYLAGGWLANVAMVAVFLAALGALALVRRSWRAVAMAGGLLGAAGLTHRLFFLVGLVILAGAAAAHVGEARADLRAGRPVRDAALVRMLVAGVGAGAAVLLAFASLGGPMIPGDTSQDGFFRRVGLRGLLVERYRERFWGDLGRASVAVVAGLGLGAAAVWDRSARWGSGARFAGAVGTTWAAITLGGIAVFAVTGWAPPNRLLQFAFFLPLAAAVGVAVLATRGAARAVIGMVAAIVFTAVAMVGWLRQSPAFRADELVAVGKAARIVRALPVGTPLLFVVDTRQPAAAYHVTRAGNVIRMALPAERIPDVRLVVGRAEDVLAGRPTLTGDAEHDALSAVYLRDARPVLRRATVLELRAFDEIDYARARDIGAEVAPGVVVLTAAPPVSGTEALAPSGLGPAGLVTLSVAALLALGLVGGGWARWGLPGAGRRAVAAAAPSVGIGVSALGAFAADRVGLLPGGFGSMLVVLGIAAGGYLAAGRARGRGR